MDGSSAAKTVKGVLHIGFSAFALAALSLVPARTRADVSVHACPVELTTTFSSLLNLELSSETQGEVEVQLTCSRERGIVKVRRDGRLLEREVSLATDDAGRWLALAAAELVARIQEASPPPEEKVAAPKPALTRRGWLHVAARGRLGDESRLLRWGGDLGYTFILSWSIWLDGTLRFTTGERAVAGPVRVRASDASAALSAGYLFEAGTLRFLPGVGVVAGAARLSAESSDDELDLRSLTRGFAGPVAMLRMQWLLTLRFAVELSLEGAYAAPGIEGRDELRGVLFTQTPWHAAASLGATFAL